MSTLESPKRGYLLHSIGAMSRGTSANPNLRKDAVADLVKTHVLTLKEVIDAQASGNVVQAYAALRHAADHMALIANPLADAIVEQFPIKYAI